MFFGRKIKASTFATDPPCLPGVTWKLAYVASSAQDCVAYQVWIEEKYPGTRIWVTSIGGKWMVYLGG